MCNASFKEFAYVESISDVTFGLSEGQDQKLNVKLYFSVDNEWKVLF